MPPTPSDKARSYTEDRALAMDQDTVIIQKIATAEWPTMAPKIINGLRRKLLAANPPPTSRMDSKTAVNYFNELRYSVEFEASKIVQSYSAAQWLWYLRRLPEVFGGKLQTTGPYDRLLAELLSGMSEREASSPATSGYEIRFPVTDGVVKRTLRLCATAIVLSSIHARLRRTGKGLEYEYDGTNLPSSIPNASVDEAISLYDRRSEEDVGDFGVGGTRVFSRVDRAPSTTEASPALLVGVTSDWRLLPTLMNGSEVVTIGRYIPTLMSVSDLPNILVQARGGEDKWWDPALPALLALVKAAWWELAEDSTSGWLSLVRYGYLTEHWRTLHQTLEYSLPLLRDEINGMFPGACPADAAEAIEVLQMIKAQSWPPLPGPVLRPSGDGAFVDLQAATNRLYRMMALTPSGNTIANIQAGHFEDVVQSRIDASAWAPSPTLRDIRGHDLRRLDDTFMTDLDAVGEFGDTLLVVDCKSTPYTAEYDAGFYTAVRNIQSTLLEKLANWARVMDELKVAPIGPNYDFSQFSRIVGVVCTPHIFYVPIGAATQTVITSPNGVPLRTVSSYSEMDRFLADYS